jgi:hypothetical protein
MFLLDVRGRPVVPAASMSSAILAWAIEHTPRGKPSTTFGASS